MVSRPHAIFATTVSARTTVALAVSSRFSTVNPATTAVHQRFHFTCFRCGLVYSEVVSASLADMPEGLSPDAQIEALVDLTSETDRLVRERVREQQA